MDPYWDWKLYGETVKPMVDVDQKHQAETPGHHLDPTVKISSSYSRTKSWTQKIPPQNTNPTKNGAPNDTFMPFPMPQISRFK